MQIQTIQPEDYQEIAALIEEAFTRSSHGYGEEAELVEKIRASDEYIPEFEIVTRNEANEITGHALLSEASVIDNFTSLTGLVLAPISVAPDHQKSGLGSALINELEQRAQEQGYPFISILGDPGYYSRFGYRPASHYSIQAPFDVPKEVFLIKELQPKALEQVQGTLCYSSAFD